jgi:hypothetical protein
VVDGLWQCWMAGVWLVGGMACRGQGRREGLNKEAVVVRLDWLDRGG